MTADGSCTPAQLAVCNCPADFYCCPTNGGCFQNPADVIYTCRHFRRQMTNVKVPRDAYVNVMGTDLVRLPDGQFVVLEDNLRVPSGVSYMLSSRKVMKQIFPALFRKYGVRPIEQYSQMLLSTLRPTRSRSRATTPKCLTRRTTTSSRMAHRRTRT